MVYRYAFVYLSFADKEGKLFYNIVIHILKLVNTFLSLSHHFSFVCHMHKKLKHSDHFFRPLSHSPSHFNLLFCQSY